MREPETTWQDSPECIVCGDSCCRLIDGLCEDCWDDIDHKDDVFGVDPPPPSEERT